MKEKINFNSHSKEKQKGVVNVGSTGKTETERMLSNLAPTPFELDGKHYESVEGFWQGLKFSEGSQQRDEIAKLSGVEAKKAGAEGKKFQVSSDEHQELMRKAIKAKLEQNPHVLNLLLATRNKKIIHFPKTSDGQIFPDSQTIPREKFCQILMDLREKLRI